MGSKRLTPTRVGKNGLKMFVVVVVVVCVFKIIHNQVQICNATYFEIQILSTHCKSCSC